MLNFYFIADEQPDNASSAELTYAGGVEETEFAMAQQAGLIDHHTGYYEDFRWTSEQVASKLFLLSTCPFRASTALQDILNQAQKTGAGVIAFGD